MQSAIDSTPRVENIPSRRSAARICIQEQGLLPRRGARSPMDELTALFPNLSASDRALLAEWLAEFDQSWAPGRLEQCVPDLPPAGHPLRYPTLVGMVRIDLCRQWRGGDAGPLGEYPKRYPQLGPGGQTPREVLAGGNPG